MRKRFLSRFSTIRAAGYTSFIKKEFLKANYEGGYSADRKYDEFVDKYDLLIMKEGDNTIYKLKNSKKYIISIFPDKEKEITSYIKQT